MSLQPTLGETITVRFVTSGADGAATDASPMPICEILVDDDDTPVVALTVTKRSGKTGQYRTTIFLQAPTFQAGRSYTVMGYAMVGGKGASAPLASFTLRYHTADGTNVLFIAGQPAQVDTTPPGTLVPAERTAIAAAVKSDVGNDTVAGSLGKYSKDGYDAMLRHGGLMITGVVAASPAPLATSFKVTLDVPLAGAKTPAGFVGQHAILRGGGGQTEVSEITACTIHSTTSLTLTFAVTDAFSVAPVAGDPMSISR